MKNEEKIMSMLETLVTKVSTIEVDLAGVKTELAGVKTELAGVKTELAEVKADLAETKITVKDTHERVVIIENEQGKLLRLVSEKLDVTADRLAQMQPVVEVLQDDVSMIKKVVSPTRVVKSRV